MSRASKLTLLGTSAFALGTVALVHWQQQAEKEAMHAGVIRDMEQQRIKRERQLDFEMQRELENEYKKLQTVRDVTDQMDPVPTKPNALTAGLPRPSAAGSIPVGGAIGTGTGTGEK
ncbi:hypothetical protein GE21DRAFT_9488 [Neurospora crassa]|uniref:Cytochrome c oxidase assembly protein n=2 Tax=Neurospora crassa TaxID=5141 RepID=Q1K5M1_NEUCR|nr:hypothetical protein NCU05119 [Neurospora crassa OR74A]EAA27869.1 hypothetical protein NCU05119 [Neurospora crassa OR74A]KHE87988.1 hypothetical protein GE21DRAFT_9488 [Neurospora crassa]CAD70444.1 related to cytochrome c oxidase assembly factor [Neurospora crassa]|eukprot:XP_957105.1 hypothetical protein NCU05119 [Neurospora crassa OR74A]